MALGWEIVLRLITIGANLLLLVLILSGEVRKPIRTAFAGLLLGSTSYLLNSAPQFGLPHEVRIWIDIFSIFTPFWTWLFARHLFEREPSLRLVVMFAAAVLASWFVAYFLPQTEPLGFVGIHVISLVLLGDNCYFGEDDLKSEQAMMLAQLRSRNHPEFRRLVCDISTLAIYDDHDFGPNDADGHFAGPHRDSQTR